MADDDGSVKKLDRLVELLDSELLVASFVRGDLTREQLINALAARYQASVGTAVNTLAEHDKELAQQVGIRLRRRVNELLETLERRDTEPDSLARPREKPAKADMLKDRDDAVLLREYAILKALSKTNEAFKSSELFKLVRTLFAGVLDDAITAHLVRMAKAGVIGKERKGRYNSVPAGAEHMQALAQEIEARGLKLPEVPPLA
jgi:hypothetical protein